jgi:hypothetical protein
LRAVRLEVVDKVVLAVAAVVQVVTELLQDHL